MATDVNDENGIHDGKECYVGIPFGGGVERDKGEYTLSVLSCHINRYILFSLP